ncbi:MAG: iron-containing alcohol dehydrogenase [Roseibacillus sp.]
MSVQIKEYTTSWTEDLMATLGHGPIFAVIDPTVEARFGIVDELKALRPETDVIPFTDFPPNPTWECLRVAGATAQSKGVQSVLALGGGTAIDLGKLTAAALQLGGVDELWTATADGSELAVLRSGIRLMAIPTTAGTGAEATRFAVLYRDGIKHSVVGDALLPDAWALDPSLLTTLPSSVIIAAGLDAVCQAMESLWSVRSTPESDGHAWAALDLGSKHLEPAVRVGDDLSLAGMLVAAHLAGRAINITTTTAPHALSYGLTSLCGIPHGRAVAALFGQIFDLNFRVTADHCAHPRGVEFVQQRLGEIAARWGQTIESFPASWQSFVHEGLGVSPLLVDRGLLDRLAASVNPTRLANNPRIFRTEEIRTLYESLSQ